MTRFDILEYFSGYFGPVTCTDLSKRTGHKNAGSRSFQASLATRLRRLKSLWTLEKDTIQNGNIPTFPAKNKSLEYHCERPGAAGVGKVKRQGLARKRPQGQTMWGHMNSRCGRCRTDKPYIPRLRQHRGPAPTLRRKDAGKD